MPSILIVDDEPHITSALRRLFRRRGFEVELAANGAEALSKLELAKPDVVLSDFRMPGMTGAELLTHVKVRAPEAMRLMLSGYADLKAMAAAVNDGEICRFISKPWDDEALVNVVNGALARRKVGAELMRPFEQGGASPALVQHEASVELKFSSDPSAPVSAQRAAELIGRILGLLHEKNLELVAGVLERHGGRLCITAEVGGAQHISIEVPCAIGTPAEVSA
jgi:two-component system, OmpR family, response regulator VicR